MSRSRESDWNMVRVLWWMVFGVETGSDAWGREWIWGSGKDLGFSRPPYTAVFCL